MIKIFAVKIIPNASFDKILGKMDDDTIKISIKAIRENGKANKRLLDFLAEKFGWKWQVIRWKTASKKWIQYDGDDENINLLP